MNWRQILDDAVESVAAQVLELGGDAETSLDEIKARATSDANRLAGMVGRAGFNEAVLASGINLAMFSALKSVDAADALDKAAREAWITGMTTALRVTASVIAAL